MSEKVIAGLPAREYMRRYRQSDKFKESRRKYQQSDKYKEYQRKYQQSDKCKESQRKYQQSDKFKESQRKYQQSDKGKEYQRTHVSPKTAVDDFMKHFGKKEFHSNKERNLTILNYGKTVCGLQGNCDLVVSRIKSRLQKKEAGE